MFLFNFGLVKTAIILAISIFAINWWLSAKAYLFTDEAIATVARKHVAKSKVNGKNQTRDCTAHTRHTHTPPPPGTTIVYRVVQSRIHCPLTDESSCTRGTVACTRSVLGIVFDVR